MLLWMLRVTVIKDHFQPQWNWKKGKKVNVENMESTSSCNWNQLKLPSLPTNWWNFIKVQHITTSFCWFNFFFIRAIIGNTQTKTCFDRFILYLSYFLNGFSNLLSLFNGIFNPFTLFIHIFKAKHLSSSCSSHSWWFIYSVTNALSFAIWLCKSKKHFYTAFF